MKRKGGSKGGKRICWLELFKMIYNCTKYFPVITIFPSASLFSKNSYLLQGFYFLDWFCTKEDVAGL